MVSIEAIAAAAYRLRKTSIEITTQAGSGHPTSCLSAADIIATLFFRVMQYDTKDPLNDDNDRFILSKGHAAPILYAVYHELGIISAEELHTYRQIGSRLEGHPTPRFPYVAAATGSLGQGLSIGAGMAFNRGYENKEYYTYILMGDSELAEGSIWEAAAVAAYHKLDHLIGIVEVNRLGQSVQVMGGVDLSYYSRKFEAFGWHTFTVNGHNIEELITIFEKARAIRSQPVAIIAHTIKGAGVPSLADQNGWHGKVVPKDQLEKVLLELAVSTGTNAIMAKKNWNIQFPSSVKFSRKPQESNAVTPHYKIKELIAPRKAFGKALEIQAALNPAIIVLDAEVQNSTYTEFVRKKTPEQFIECFVAEQNMVGMAVGLAACKKNTRSCYLWCFFYPSV